MGVERAHLDYNRAKLRAPGTCRVKLPWEAALTYPNITAPCRLNSNVSHEYQWCGSCYALS